MTVETESVKFQTTGEAEVVDLTGKVQAIVKKGIVKNGVVFLFVFGSTGAITTMEYEPGLVTDLPAALERVAPKNASYEHEARWHDGNGHSHIRASIVGPALFVPFQNKQLTLGTWQQIVFVEFDVRSRQRTVIVTMMGD